jgi:hypothetical protein
MERAEVRAQVRQILKSFLCLYHSRTDRTRFRWLGEIIEARDILADKMSPTLRRDVRRRLPLLYRDARALAELNLLEQGESASAFPMPLVCPFTVGDILRDDWYPQQMETIR